MENYITVDCTGSFLKNAGIVGFVKFAEYNHAVEGNDYIIDGQNLHISVEYLKNNDISQMYVDTMVDIFEKDSKFYKVVHDDSNIIKSYFDKGLENIPKKQLSILKDKFKYFENMMLKNSFKTAFDILNNNNNINISIIDMCQTLKSTSDINQKYPLYCEIIDILKNNKTIKNQLIYTELLYGNFKLFFKNNNGNSILYDTANDKRTGISYKDKYFKSFYNNIFLELELNKDYNDSKKISYIPCIDCLNTTISQVSFKIFQDIISKHKYLENKINNKYLTQKKAVQICMDNSFMSDTADNLSEKKSHYWNCNPDAFVCPNCAFIYSFVPLGFAFFGNDAVFINNNQSIKELYSIMNTYKLKTESNPNETYYQRLFKIFSNEKISALEHNIHNIQVIVRNGNLSHYDMKIIDNDIITKMVECQKHHYFTNIEKKYLKIGTDFINVYNSVLDNILMRRSQYNFIDKCLKYEFSQECEKKSCNYGYIKNILNIEINFNGGSAIMEKEKKKSYVNNLMTKVNIAFKVGKNMRSAILKKNAPNNSKEKDNSLRGYVYRLINLASVGDISQFMDTILRTYSGNNLTIPDIFKDCYQSEETFKAIAHGYILGLKYQEDNDDNNNEDNQGGQNNG